MGTTHTLPAKHKTQHNKHDGQRVARHAHNNMNTGGRTDAPQGAAEQRHGFKQHRVSAADEPHDETDLPYRRTHDPLEEDAVTWTPGTTRAGKG